jgi:2-keto-4-pentenoate hydratase
MMVRTMDERAINALADRLEAAERHREPLEPFTVEHPGMTAADAYAVQVAVTARRLRRGTRIVGYKLGLTSAAMQEQLGVDQPDYGPILADWVVTDGGTIHMEELIQPRIEAEIAFVLGSDLVGPGIDAEAVRAATATLVPALEVIDSRIRDWRIGLADTIADLASTARVILGATPIPAREAGEPRALQVVLERDGKPVAHGVGAAALGDPIEAVAWAANTLGALGVTLEAGHVIMTGALHASVPILAGETYRATVAGLGSVGVSIG